MAADVGAVPVQTAIDRIGFGRFQKRLLGVCGVTWAADAAEIFIIAFALPKITEDFGLTTFQRLGCRRLNVRRHARRRLVLGHHLRPHRPQARLHDHDRDLCALRLPVGLLAEHVLAVRVPHPRRLRPWRRGPARLQPVRRVPADPQPRPLAGNLRELLGRRHRRRRRAGLDPRPDARLALPARQLRGRRCARVLGPPADPRVATLPGRHRPRGRGRGDPRPGRARERGTGTRRSAHRAAGRRERQGRDQAPVRGQARPHHGDAVEHLVLHRARLLRALQLAAEDLRRARLRRRPDLRLHAAARRRTAAGLLLGRLAGGALGPQADVRHLPVDCRAVHVRVRHGDEPHGADRGGTPHELLRARRLVEPVRLHARAAADAHAHHRHGCGERHGPRGRRARAAARRRADPGFAGAHAHGLRARVRAGGAQRRRARPRDARRGARRHRRRGGGRARLPRRPVRENARGSTLTTTR